VLFLTNTAFSQEKLKNPNSEVEDAIKYLSDTSYVKPEDVKYIRFLTTYAIQDEEKRQREVLSCSFILHSLVGPAKDLDSNNAGAFYPLAKIEEKKFVEKQKVPFSDTLWWIDLRDYNFTPEVWELAASIDGFFVTPTSVQEQNNGALRLLAGNAILRMDWFNTHVTDTSRQRDIDKDFDLYTSFVFAQVPPPKNVEEWRKYMALDVTKTRELGNEFGTLVTKSEQVSRHNRMLFGYRTELGYMYDTYDVKNQEGLRDYWEAFFKNKKIGTPPDISDAGELFATNQLGLQVYALRDGNGNLINFGDPTVVRHLTDIHGDVRVRVAHSCIDCHSIGPLPAENTHAEFLKKTGEIYSYSKEDRNRIKRVFLDNRFEDSITFNQQIFKTAIDKANGLTPEVNGQYYLESIKHYTRDVDLERAAFECGVTTEEFKDKITKGRFGGRIKLLVETGQPIPIDIWETRGKDGIPGQFQQAMALINGITQITTETTIEHKIPQDIKDNLKNILLEDTYLMSGQTKVILIPKDTILPILEEKSDWIKTEYNGRTGWLEKKFMKTE
jgi:hypothetical protein